MDCCFGKVVSSNRGFLPEGFVGTVEAVNGARQEFDCDSTTPGPLHDCARNVGTVPLRTIESGSVSVMDGIRRRKISGPTSGPMTQPLLAQRLEFEALHGTIVRPTVLE